MKLHKINIKFFLLTLISTTILFAVFFSNVFAQVTTGTPDATRQFDIDDNINIEPITIPVFGDLALGIDPHATLFSWLSFGANLIIVVLVVFWIFLILRAGFEAIKSEGDSEKISEASKKVRSAVIGVAMTLIFPAILSVIGALMGLGPLWAWPAALRDCPNLKDSGGSQFYFQEVLVQADNGEANPRAAADVACF